MAEGYWMSMENLKAQVEGRPLPYGREAMKDKDMENSVERTIWIAAPRERVWNAVTDPKQIEQWWGDNWEIDALKIGGTVKFYQDISDVSTATIEVVDPPREFSFRWHANDWHPSMVTTLTLEAENGGTRVTARDTGFEQIPAEDRQKRIDNTGEGYTIVLQALKELVEQ